MACAVETSLRPCIFHGVLWLPSAAGACRTVYWAAKVVPESWHIMPRIVRENLELFQAAVPVVTTDGSSSSSASSSDIDVDSEDPTQGYFSSGPRELDGDNVAASGWVVHCSSPVNQTSLKPVDVAYCQVSERANGSAVQGAFQVQRSWHRVLLRQQGRPSAGQQQRQKQRAAAAVLSVGPMGSALQQLWGWLRTYWALRLLLRCLGWVVSYAVPTGGLAALQPLLVQLHVLELEWQWEVLVVYFIGEGCVLHRCTV